VAQSDAKKAIERLAQRENADLYIFNSSIVPVRVDRLRHLICERKNRRTNAIVFLTTFGGDPDAAFRLAACLRRNYTSVAAYIFGLCKSAGTLAVTGADRIVYGDFGELGPLDVQMTKPDEIYPTSSGLDIFQAVGVLTNSAFEAFQKYLVEIISNSEGHISAKTSAEIARELAVGLFAPMTAQIEPERLGEMQRAITIANEYGARLTRDNRNNLKKDALERLVQGYPGHGFVIDLAEAKTLFNNVREADQLERKVASFIPGLRRPSEAPIIHDLTSLYNMLGAKNVTQRPPQARAKRASRGVQPAGAGRGGNVAHIRPNAASDGKVAQENADAGGIGADKDRSPPTPGGAQAR
jgi:hypothetical protein